MKGLEMKGPEEVPRRATEERVRDAFGAAAETLTAQDLPGLPTPARRSWTAWGLRAWAPRARMRALAPVAAAACVAVIAVTATVVVPKLLAGPPGGPAAGLAGAPAFFAGVATDPRGNAELNIYRSANGRMVAAVPLPGRDHTFAAVTRLGGDQSYVVAAARSRRACDTQLYRFTIGPSGQPSRLAPLSVPHVRGTVMELVGSAAGNVLAYTASGPCTPRSHSVIGVVRPATRQVTTWTYAENRRQPDPAGSVSLTADGSVLGFSAGPNAPYGLQDVWVLPTSSPSGSLTRHARKVLRVRSGVFREVLSNTGAQVYVETLSAPHGVVILGQYSTATGKRIRVLGRLGTGGQQLSELSVSQDAAGQHLLVYGYLRHPNRIAEMNLATGHLASVTVPQTPLGSPFSSDAW
jgi:hypothetical protein